MLRIIVVDAQGGGLGASIIKTLCSKYEGRVEIVALGTNAIATSAMQKAGAVACATGENAVCFNSDKADVIMGGIGIIAASGMMGEITPAMAKSIAESAALKVLIPISRCNIVIPGSGAMNAKELIEAAAEELARLF